MTDQNTTILPRSQAPLVDSGGRPTREFYYFFQRIVQGIEGQIADLTNLVNSVVLISKSLGSPDGSAQEIIDVVNSLAAKVDTSRVVTGAMSVAGGGTLADDLILTLKGDRNVPGLSMFYGTDDSGNLGWQPQGLPGFVTTDQLPEGTVNLYFTDERAQDAVGAALSDSSNVTLTYDDATPAITGDLTATGVSAGTYGDATHIPKITVDSKGRVLEIVLISTAGTFGILIAGGGNLLTSSGGRLLGQT